ncbi:MAG: Holliday junction branch migration protein RuvA [Alphaproteobacteria bacterium]|nr:Holliday junction branch migration protein RuvA [Alphaproteobacteria bacterium]MCL2757771.1 Holliday junction branch migration protein RuvA [Alphaproteobacteria bacterium]
MIGKLQGIVDHVGDGWVILDVNGVGYKVFTPDMPQATGHESQVTMWIETVVREDSIRLFGFATQAGLELFNQLTTVSGVGPKVALAILSTLKPDVLLPAIATGDSKTISSAPGVGKKVAEKIIVELKGKTVAGGSWLVAGDDKGSALSDLLSALESLGYRRADSAEMAQTLVRDNPDADVGTLVRLALKDISK